MLLTDEFELWNLTQNGTARTGAMDVFNVVGHLTNPLTVRELDYRLNDGPRRPVYFNRSAKRDGRLQRPGDFNIDTIRLSELQAENTLQVVLTKENGDELTESVRFSASPFENGPPDFTLDLQEITAAEQVGQVVDGRWIVSRDETGRLCLEVSAEQTGYDRIVIFGHRAWTTGYEVLARLAVTRFRGIHNVGTIFKWNPHAAGDGSCLPTQWNSGLGYYRSYEPGAGLCIRFGVNAYDDPDGTKHGSYMLGQTPFCRPRRWGTQLLKTARRKGYVSDMALGRDYFFRMRVADEAYSLTAWRADRREPSPQLVVERPLDHLPQGSAGILAHRAAVRLYEFTVRPV